MEQRVALNQSGPIHSTLFAHLRPNNTLEVQWLRRKLFVLLPPLPSTLHFSPELPDKERQNENKFRGDRKQDAFFSIYFFFFEEAECASGRTSSAQAGMSPMHARQSGQRQRLSTPVAGTTKMLLNVLRHVRGLYRPNTSQQHLLHVHIFTPSKCREYCRILR